MSKVSETLGALNVLGRYFLKKTVTPSYAVNEDGSVEDDLSPAQSLSDKVVSSPPLHVPPEKDEQLGDALYTLGRNVLGQVMEESGPPADL